MSDQLPLFSEPRAAPQPVHDAAALRELAHKLPKHLRLGTSSWTFEGWKQLVYQRKYANRADFTRRSLEEYAQHPLFRTVGIDRSYYAPVGVEELENYRRQLPDDFRCVCKAFSDITTVRFPDHPSSGDFAGKANPSFLDPVRFVDEVATPTKQGLGPNAGPFLLQFRPFPSGLTPRFFEDKLAAFLKLSAQDHDISVELRDPRFLTKRYFETLHRFRASHCFSYWSRMPPLERQLELYRDCPVKDESPTLVVRLLLPPNKEYGAQKEAFAPFNRIVVPQPEMRNATVELIRYGELLGKEMFLLVNNKAEGSSPLTLRAIAELLT